MKAKASKIVKTINTSEIPNGTYPGVWGGNLVAFRVGDDEYQATATTSIRAIDAKCTVVVANGHIDIECA